MPFIVYLDETGDHSLDTIDKSFPIFALIMLICDTEEYVSKIVPMFNRLKIDTFGHEGIIIHSRDIRKAQGDFGFLTNPAARQPFYERINEIMRECDFQVIAAVIHKEKHRQRYNQNAANPYDLALTFAMERLLPCLEQCGQNEVVLVAESRGKNEDDDLQLSFLRIISNGTDYNHADRFKKINFRLQFRPKAMNIIGTQLADLIAYPTARFVLNPAQPNPAYDLIKDKFYKGSGWVKGLKIFP